MVAIGCAEGVWIGFRHDSRCAWSRSCHSCFPLTFLPSYASCTALEDGATMRHAGGLWYLPRPRGQGSYPGNCVCPLSLTSVTLVVVRVPHRGTSTIVAAKSAHFPDTTEAQRKQGRALLQCRQSARQNSRHLHEEERGGSAFVFDVENILTQACSSWTACSVCWSRSSVKSTRGARHRSRSARVSVGGHNGRSGSESTAYVSIMKVEPPQR